MLLGLYIAFFMSHQRIWLYKNNDSSVPQLWLSGSANKNKMGFAKVLSELKKCIDQAVQR
jgi:cytochrome c biogenesis protein